ncbi:MAG: hypothetical protein AB7Q00_15185 [Phycisphaerales bacterium]
MQITIQLDTNNDADKNTLTALLGTLSGGNTPSAAPAEPEKPRRARKTADPVGGNPDAMGTEAAISDAGNKSEPAAVGVGRSDVASAVRALVEAKGRQAAVDVLEKFRPDGFKGEVVGVKDIPEARYPEVLKAAQEALKS